MGSVELKKMESLHKILFFILSVHVLAISAVESNPDTPPPNVVIFFADDLIEVWRRLLTFTFNFLARKTQIFLEDLNHIPCSLVYIEGQVNMELL